MKYRMRKQYQDPKVDRKPNPCYSVSGKGETKMGMGVKDKLIVPCRTLGLSDGRI